MKPPQVRRSPNATSKANADPASATDPRNSLEMPLLGTELEARKPFPDTVISCPGSLAPVPLLRGKEVTARAAPCERDGQGRDEFTWYPRVQDFHTGWSVPRLRKGGRRAVQL